MMRKFTDTYGATLTLAPVGNGEVTLSIKDGDNLGVSRKIVDATRLSQKELERARAGRKLKVNKYTRLGEAEQPIGDYTGINGVELLIYPDKANHVLIELVGVDTAASNLCSPV